jgi:hypothetical protein
MEQAVQALAVEFMKELDILLAPISQPPAEIPRASDVAAAPLVEESVSRPENGTSGKQQKEQTNKVVSIAETLLNELITWKEMINEGWSEEQQVPELRRRLACSEEALRFKGTAYNIAVFEHNQLRSAQAEKERAIERLTVELDAEKKARRKVERSRADAWADIKSLHRRLDIAKKDAADVESRLRMAMETLHKITK